MISIQETKGSNIITIRFASDPDLFALDPTQGITTIAESVATNAFFPVAFFPVFSTNPTDMVRVKSDADIAEPEGYAMLLASLGLIRFIASRRKPSLGT